VGDGRRTGVEVVGGSDQLVVGGTGGTMGRWHSAGGTMGDVVFQLEPHRLDALKIDGKI
jgi:hypothetical protein